MKYIVILVLPNRPVEYNLSRMALSKTPVCFICFINSALRNYIRFNISMDFLTF